MKALLLLGLILGAGASFAQSGADLLLESTGTTVEATKELDKNESFLSFEMNKFKLTDHFLQSLFVEWKSAGQQSFEINRWVGLVLSHDFKGAAHLWSSLQEHMPESLRLTLNTTWAYLNWRLDLPQTFLHSWRRASQNAKGTRAWLALEQVLAKEGSSSWAIKNRPYMDPAFATEILSNPQEGFSLELAAWAARYDLQNAAIVLEKLPPGHPLSIDLAKTAVLNYARNNSLGEAGKLLKRRIEPDLKKMGEPKLLAGHYLALGRLLYQAGALEAAEAFYSQVPKGLPEFIPARAERTWALLRLGRISELRGELESLSHKVLSDRFLPEVSLVRSISNLKLCRYDDVAADFKVFIEANSIWVNKISKALAQEGPVVEDADPRIDSLELALRNRTQEEERLNKLAQESIKAALPAVGEQAHWVEAKNMLIQGREADRRLLVAEKRRFWKNRELVLTEAIRKMKFVKVEAMAQLRLAASTGSGDEVSNVQAAAQGKMTYPFEGVYWPDELFHLHAKARTNCGGAQ